MGPDCFIIAAIFKQRAPNFLISLFFISLFLISYGNALIPG